MKDFNCYYRVYSDINDSGLERLVHIWPTRNRHYNHKTTIKSYKSQHCR